eukprot:5730859-Lingulodinium_polyedra.AAC.1
MLRGGFVVVAVSRLLGGCALIVTMLCYCCVNGVRVLFERCLNACCWDALNAVRQLLECILETV